MCVGEITYMILCHVHGTTYQPQLVEETGELSEQNNEENYSLK
jgi:hypothetical protein